MLTQQTLPGFNSAIFSRASADGVMPCGWQAGPTSAKSGPAPVLASLFPAPENSAGSPTAATCGRNFTGSSASAALQSLLASRLQARLASRGGTLYRMIWRTATTPAGRSISRLQASALRTSGNGCTGAGCPTPAGTDGKGGYRGGRMRRGKPSTDRLDVTAQLAGWATPTASNGNGPRPNPLERDFPNLQTQAFLAGWCTPTATDAQRGNGTIRPWDTGLPLAQQASLADSGPSTNGDGAATESIGQLNPALSLWLMGYPDEWLSCAASATQSCRNRRRRSSKP